MPNAAIAIKSQHVITLRLDVAEIRAEGSHWRPILKLPVKITLSPVGGPDAEPWANYVFSQLSGALYHPSSEELATFLVPSVVEEVSSQLYERDLPIRIELTPAVVQRVEDLRAGKDPQFELSLQGVASSPAGKVERVVAHNKLGFKVPRSTWTDQVLDVWKLSSYKLIEIEFADLQVGEDLRRAYSKIEEAERHYSNDMPAQCLANIYAAFEGLAKARGFKNPDQQFFAGLLADSSATNREKGKLLFAYYCNFLQLGRHEAGPPETTEAVISRREARLALIFAHATLEYFSRPR
jgi:hypothetical protein